MNHLTLKSIITVMITLSFHFGSAKDYRDKPVGDYSNASVDLTTNRANTTFLTFMKDTFYDVIESQAANQTHWAVSHLKDIAQGIGAELRLAPDVTTYHVKYADSETEKAIQSGRSFGVVHSGPIEAGDVVDYIADASYFFYLSELEELLKDEKQARIFYETIFKFLIKTDSSGFNDPGKEEQTKRVAADFVAVYVAEQYRRLLEHDGEKISRRHAWEEAHLQTTLLGNFHAGQSKENRGMYFVGRYTTTPYVQRDSRGTWEDKSDDICGYGILKNRRATKKQKALLEVAKTEPFELHNYWQFGSECGGRSGVNVTRRDFEKLGQVITKWMNDNGKKRMLNKLYSRSEKVIRTQGRRANFIDSFAEAMSDDDAPEQYKKADKLIEALVDVVMEMRESADKITKEVILK